MPKPAQLTDFQRSLKSLDYTRKRMETLLQKGEITKRDLNSVYEALFFRAVTGLEFFLEELFLAILERRIRYKKQRKIALKMKPKSRQALVEIVFQGDNYLDLVAVPENRREGGLLFTRRSSFQRFGTTRQRHH